MSRADRAAGRDRPVKDPNALAELMQGSRSIVWRACAVRVDYASADDLTQETFARAIRSLPNYRGEAALSSWLVAIARRVCADEIRRRQRVRRLDEQLGRRLRETCDPSTLVDLTDAIDRLPVHQREAFLLTAVAGLSYADTASALGCPIGTVRSRVARARDHLIRSVLDQPFAADGGMTKTRERPAVTSKCRAGLAAAAAVVLVGGCASSGGPSNRAAHVSGSASMSAMPAPAGTARARIGHLTITGGYIPQPASPDVAAAYFTVTNSGSSADTLIRVTTDVTRSVMAMNESDSGGTGSMTDLARVRIPAHGSFRFRPGHAHLMLEKPDRALRKGDGVQMRITFANAGTVTLMLPVVGLTGPSESMPTTSSSMPGGGMPGMSMSGGS